MATVGTLALALGVVGVAVPLLPTTPFLLLAAACYMRGSRRLYRWLVGHPWLGPFLRNYRENRAISLRTKVVALATLWAAVGYSSFMVVESILLRVVLLLVAIGVSLHLLTLRTL
ncbi:MAG: DUF454 family protein [Chitinivibrionales bacterium]|nr:DUF454 family protein [Chitinivibrionales bacterium]MBD3355603.1 DUF454 family protein [Chitinivibrionales bacterium]